MCHLIDQWELFLLITITPVHECEGAALLTQKMAAANYKVMIPVYLKYKLLSPYGLTECFSDF